MTANFNLASIKPASGTTSRTLGERFEDVINVKDHGATGGGSLDDTAAIYRAMAAAWGPFASPNGSDDRFDNKPLYFPPGDYLVSSPTVMTVSAIASGVDGAVKCTVDSTAGWQTHFVGSMYDVPGDYGGTPDRYIDPFFIGMLGSGGTWSLIIDDLTHVTLYRSDYSAAPVGFAVGGKIGCAALQIYDVRGGIMFGGGSQSTRIFASGGGVIATNGMDYCRISDISLTGSNSTRGLGRTTCAFDWFWRKNLAEPNHAGLGSVQFHNVTFGQCDYGLRIGAGGDQGSELLSLACTYGSIDVAGISVWNQNSLMITVTGGNIAQMRTYGIWSLNGAVVGIKDVSFQENNGTEDWEGWDIWQGSQGSPLDAVVVIGCRSESKNFITNELGAGTVLIGCSGGNQVGGCFADCIGPVLMIGCNSTYGDVKTTHGGAQISGWGNSFPSNELDGSWLDTTTQLHAARAITMGFINYRDIADSSGNLVNATFANLQPAHLRIASAEAVVYDSTVNTVDAIIAGGGSNIVKAKCVWDTSGTPAWKWKVHYLIK